MREALSLVWTALVGLFRSPASLAAEILVLRHQINILRRLSPKRQTFSAMDRLIFAGLYRLAPTVLNALAIVKPETVIKWHRAGFRSYWLYVAAVVDLFSRRVVGWSMSTAMTAQLVTDALVMAIWRRGRPDALLHHSDRGSQYTSEQFQRLMADHGVVCSMSRSGNVWDNAAMESFFSSLKMERTARKVYRSRDEAKADVFDYIERFYNPKRRHSTIGYLSPMEFERQGGLA
jgi:putative transposase